MEFYQTLQFDPSYLEVSVFKYLTENSYQYAAKMMEWETSSQKRNLNIDKYPPGVLIKNFKKGIHYILTFHNGYKKNCRIYDWLNSSRFRNLNIKQPSEEDDWEVCANFSQEELNVYVYKYLLEQGLWRSATIFTWLTDARTGMSLQFFRECPSNLLRDCTILSIANDRILHIYNVDPKFLNRRWGNHPPWGLCPEPGPVSTDIINQQNWSSPRETCCGGGGGGGSTLGGGADGEEPKRSMVTRAGMGAGSSRDRCLRSRTVVGSSIKSETLEHKKQKGTRKITHLKSGGRHETILSNETDDVPLAALIDTKSTNNTSVTIPNESSHEPFHHKTKPTLDVDLIFKSDDSDVIFACWNPKKKIIACGLSDQVKIFCEEYNENYSKSKSIRGVTCANWNPDGTDLLVGTIAGSLHILSLTGDSTNVIHRQLPFSFSNVIMKVLWNEKGNSFVCGGVAPYVLSCKKSEKTWIKKQIDCFFNKTFSHCETSIWDMSMKENETVACAMSFEKQTKSDEPPGVSSQSDEPPGVSSHSDEPPGVSIQSDEPPGVISQSDEPPGVIYQSDEPPGVSSQSDAPPGVSSQSDEPPGVSSKSNNPPGVSSQSDEPPGVSSQSDEPPMGAVSVFSLDNNNLSHFLQEETSVSTVEWKDTYLLTAAGSYIVTIWKITTEATKVWYWNPQSVYHSLTVERAMWIDIDSMPYVASINSDAVSFFKFDELTDPSQPNCELRNDDMICWFDYCQSSKMVAVGALNGSVSLALFNSDASLENWQEFHLTDQNDVSNHLFQLQWSPYYEDSKYLLVLFSQEIYSVKIN
eukprot:GHVL01042018.1.p1 GENE.GHVL01042018.1~~GHVL01042018.1.p1  ORF type:complete len:809 (-),score=190.15 GHVL01042018.1:1622-4048(-)